MALHYDITRCPGPKTFEYDGKTRMHPTLETLILCSPVMQLGEITEANLDEWRFRLACYERLFGALRTVGGTPAPFEPQDVADYVGLKVNVTPSTRAQFLRHMTKVLAAEIERELRKESACVTSGQ